MCKNSCHDLILFFNFFPQSRKMWLDAEMFSEFFVSVPMIEIFRISSFCHLPFIPSHIFTLSFPLLLFFLRRTSLSVFLSHKSSHTLSLAHTVIPSVPFYQSLLLRAFCGCGGNMFRWRAPSRYLLDVLVNTAGAVTVMYGCNPNSAAWHGCQLPRETRWFIFCSSAYGLI